MNCFALSPRQPRQHRRQEDLEIERRTVCYLNAKIEMIIEME